MPEINLSPWTKRLIIVGVIAISIIAMFIDFTGGKELALVSVGGLLALMKGGE